MPPKALAIGAFTHLPRPIPPITHNPYLTSSGPEGIALTFHHTQAEAIICGRNTRAWQINGECFSVRLWEE
ncbi:hypothetical protein WMY93_031485 [Mugilogobius chulae]|uniref:Uncharacterized protein n=1 Tax=Mugilogobius chulae TaxID=88201 RepID=A0AAW0MEJ7_9GOBI